MGAQAMLRNPDPGVLRSCYTAASQHRPGGGGADPVVLLQRACGLLPLLVPQAIQVREADDAERVRATAASLLRLLDRALRCHAKQARPVADLAGLVDAAVDACHHTAVEVCGADRQVELLDVVEVAARRCAWAVSTALICIIDSPARAACAISQAVGHALLAFCAAEATVRDPTALPGG